MKKYIFALSLVVFLVYLNSFGNSFVWDDLNNIVHNKTLREAKRLAGNMLRLFWDETNGGFFFTADDAEKLLVRPKEIYDGAIPSGNSVAALDLIRLGRLTMEKKF